MIDAEFLAFMTAIAKSQTSPAATVDTQVSGDSENAVQNKAIYNFVNSSVSTNTANFIGTFNSVEALEAYSGTVTNNDYAFVVATDAAGNTVYNRYKYQGTSETWAFEYALNNSSFTAAQWATIQSGLTAADKTAIGNKVAKSGDTMTGDLTFDVGGTGGVYNDAGIKSSTNNSEVMLNNNKATMIVGSTSGSYASVTTRNTSDGQTITIEAYDQTEDTTATLEVSSDGCAYYNDDEIATKDYVNTIVGDINDVLEGVL